MKEFERKVMLFIMDNPGLSGDEIAKQMDCSRTTISFHLRNLLSQGEVRADVKERPIRFHPVPWEEMIDWSKIPQEKRPPHLRDK